ncbi:MAG: 3-hydroxyacyl-ACP dehydratase FabZ [Deltaproteobacteria bacterium]|nr:3-hydroxyacyl-ACP dehydratase FabZ [Deltaproteobacteria bacterium]
MDDTYDIMKIMELLPHRYPFLLVDRILEFEKGKRVKALKNVTINEPFFQGHFPAEPIMPGVLIIEAMAQAGGVLGQETIPKENSEMLMYFMGIDKVKFRKPVVPGDQLILDVEILRQRKTTFKMKGLASVNNKIVAEAELLATLEYKK